MIAAEIAEDTLITALASPIETTLEGTDLGAALDVLSKSWGLNLWVCPDVDTSTELPARRLGPTVLDALTQCAETSDARVLPLRDVVLIGPDPWLEKHLFAAYSDGLSGNVGPRRSIFWPDATTPSELLHAIEQATSASIDLESALSGRSPNIDDRLTHDLIRSGRWKSIDENTAKRLITTDYSTDSTDPQKSWSDTYEIPNGQRLSGKIRQVDPSAIIKQQRNKTVVFGNAAAHLTTSLAVTNRLIASSSKAASRTQKNAAKFTLRVANKPVGEVLASLAASSRKTLDISQVDSDLARTLIKLDANDKTLSELIELAAQQAGLTIRWESDRIIAAPAK